MKSTILQQDKLNSLVSKWLTEIKSNYESELGYLARVNNELSVDKQLLLEKLSSLSEVEKQLSEMVETEIEVDGVFMSNVDYDTLKQQLLQAGMHMWGKIKQRLKVIVDKPWELITNKQTTLEFNQMKMENE